MKTSFTEYIVEYYKGRNSTIGFRYSEPKLKSNLKLLLFSNKSYSELESFLEEKLNNLLDKFFLEVEISNDNDLMKKSFENMPPPMVEDIIKKRMDLYAISLDLTTYDEDEVLSLLFELGKNDNDFLITPIALLNDKEFDVYKNYRTKSRIGFKKDYE